ncbi:MAG: hypothetical protein H7Y09_07555 [Chitinophagaceae bacterium]|nr:hypothetical protein [Anaerolineae bacterium]
MPIIGLITALALCSLMAYLIFWATQATHQTIPQSFDPNKIDTEIAYDAELQAEISAGRTTNAIRLYRDLTDGTLAEAKAVIEFLIAHPDYDQSEKPKNDERGFVLDAGLREMIRSGRKTEAIRLYQEFAGISPSAASKEIERIEWEETRKQVTQR